jgi:hypothetical protein
MMMSVAYSIFQKDASSWHRAYPFRICFKLHILHLAKARCSTFVTIVTKDPMGSCHHVGPMKSWTSESQNGSCVTVGEWKKEKKKKKKKAMIIISAF